MAISKGKATICYNRNFVQQVIFKIDFAVALNKFKKVPPKIEKAIMKSFPIRGQLKQYSSTIQLAGGGPSEISKSERVVFTYHSEDKTTLLEVSDAYFAIITTKYDSYNKLKELFEKHLTLFLPPDSDFSVSRIGVRYVNVLSFANNDSPLDYARYLNQNLISSLEFPKQKSAIVRSFNSLVLSFGGMIVNMQYGVFNPDYPALIRKKEFVLDFDASTTSLIVRDEIIDFIDSAHGNIQELFESSITQEYREEVLNAK